METLRLTVAARSKEHNVKQLRNESQIPCVVYGNKTENTMISCKEQELHRIYKAAGESTIVELDLDGKNIPVLIHSLTLDPVTDRYQHVDFYAVDMSKKLTAHVPVHAIGESPAVKGLSAILLNVRTELTVTCLPKDLPHSFEVDLAKLAEFGDIITVADVKIPAGVEVEEEADTVLFAVQEPRQAEEEKPAEGAPIDGAAPAAEGAPADGAAKPEAEKKA